MLWKNLEALNVKLHSFVVRLASMLLYLLQEKVYKWMLAWEPASASQLADLL